MVLYSCVYTCTIISLSFFNPCSLILQENSNICVKSISEKDFLIILMLTWHLISSVLSLSILHECLLHIMFFSLKYKPHISAGKCYYLPSQQPPVWTDSVWSALSPVWRAASLTGYSSGLPGCSQYPALARLTRFPCTESCVTDRGRIGCPIYRRSRTDFPAIILSLNTISMKFHTNVLKNTIKVGITQYLHTCPS